MLSLVLPKGSLEKATLDLFDAADLAVRRGSDRDYHAVIDYPGIDRVRFLRPQEIPEYVEQGLFDVGITGRDWITETDSDVVSLGELHYSKATSDPVRVVLAVLPAMSSPTVTELASGEMRAVESVVPKRGVNTLIPALRAAGARDILELAISKIVE